MIEKINTILAELPPNWMSRVTSRVGEVRSPEAELRKLLGEPIPRTVNQKDLPRDVAALFGMYGMLQKIKRKLEWISRRKGNRIIPAKNTVACVDANDNIYMGVDFLEQHHTNEDLIAGIMAHEWGHMMSELLPGTDLSHLNWDQLFEVRRDEEAAADAFAGRAIFQMGYEIGKMVEFIENLEKVDKKFVTQKYYDPRLRAAILREAYAAQKRAVEQIKKLFGTRSGIIDPSSTRLIAVA